MKRHISIFAVTVAFVGSLAIPAASYAGDPAQPDTMYDPEQAVSATGNSFDTSTRNQDNSALRALEEGGRMAEATSPGNVFANLNGTFPDTNNTTYVGRYGN